MSQRGQELFFLEWRGDAVARAGTFGLSLNGEFLGWRQILPAPEFGKPLEPNRIHRFRIFRWRRDRCQQSVLCSSAVPMNVEGQPIENDSPAFGFRKAEYVVHNRELRIRRV